MIVDKVYTQDKTMQTVIERAAYYRANPHRFVKDYLGIDLRLFQMILIVMMNFNTNFMYLASRGQNMASPIRNNWAIREENRRTLNC